MFRFAIWTAVSTETQAATDKVSLSEQESACRDLAATRGWKDTGLRFVVPGESRTRWVNLRDAEMAIPELHRCLDSAQAGQFDLLLLYDYNRLRDLLDPVAKTLSHYGVQIFSLSQPSEPIPAAQYNPYASDAANIMQGMSRIISQAQIADLRRKYRYAMPRRISERGLPVQIPFGYRKPPGRETDRSAVPVQDPLRAALLVRAKDMLLAGRSLSQIVTMLIESGEHPPRSQVWYPQTVRDMLKNPFYAGYVRWGISATRLDPRTGKRTRDRHLPPSKAILARGQHVPLWDEETHRSILAELSRRSKSYRGKQNNQLTGLLLCGICGMRMHTFYNGSGSRMVHVWRCSSRQAHVVIRHSDALQRLGEKLQDELSDIALRKQPAETAGPDYAAQAQELAARRTRLEEAYLAGLFSLQTFTTQLSDIDRRTQDLESKIASRSGSSEREASRRRSLADLVVVADYLPEYLAQADPQAVNRQLHLLLAGITVREDGLLELHWAD